jgi:hypothetical protein
MKINDEQTMISSIITNRKKFYGTQNYNYIEIVMLANEAVKKNSINHEYRRLFFIGYISFSIYYVQ